MDAELVMTVIGPDRPGLVELLARIIGQHKGNWLESRMSRLSGQFAGILHVRLPQAQTAGLTDALNALRAENLMVVVEKEPGVCGTSSWKFAQLELVGHDKPGIVREISSTLAGHGVNVEELNTDCHSAPMCGEPLFSAKAVLRVPDTCKAERLRTDLEQLAENLMVDITFEDGFHSREASPPVRPLDARVEVV